MSNLATLKRNGSLEDKDSKPNFSSLSSWFDDLSLNEFPSLFSSNYNTGISLPRVNIKETTDSYIVEMAVPGLNKSDFNISLENDILNISAELKDSKEDSHDNYTRREFGYSSFKRAFNLPETVDENKINATYNEGILSLKLPKKEEARQKPPRTINIS